MSISGWVSAWRLCGVFAFGLTGCLDRPIGQAQPTTTNIVVERLQRTAVNKIDLLFVIDNSRSMGDKQKILAKALPDLVDRLVSPVCLEHGVVVAHPLSAEEECPAGSSREFEPVEDIHIGVISSSLGGYGSAEDCVNDGKPFSDQRVDMAHLVPTLPRWPSSPLEGGFLSWTRAGNKDDFGRKFAEMVTAAGEFGCGYEAPLEAWLRFLVEPAPYTKLVLQPCDSNAEATCVGPERGPDGKPLIDDELLAQRAAFLRPDSLLGIVMLSDENDCSFRAGGQSWLLARATRNGGAAYARRPTAACDANPNDPCCMPCGSSVPDSCPRGVSAETGAQVARGCESGDYYSNADPPLVADTSNLRCFEQKRRFGMDQLYPPKRYANALMLPKLCMRAADLDPAGCNENELADNPIFMDLTQSAESAAISQPPFGARPVSNVYLAGIVGVPWQDIAVSPDPTTTLVYRRAQSGASESESAIDWSWLIGEREPANGIVQPGDPLLREQLSPRQGTNPATGDALAAPDAPILTNPINGHERNISGNDLQYACIFPLEEPTLCPSTEELNEASRTGVPLPGCDCSYAEQEDEKNPLCQQPDGGYGREQRFGKAYPGLRQLQVLHDLGDNAIVASICPKQTTQEQASDFGYRPAVAAIIERLKESFVQKCMARELALESDGAANCLVVEIQSLNEPEQTACAEQRARLSISKQASEEVIRRMQSWGMCESERDCTSQYQLCGIKRLSTAEPESLTSCQNEQDAVGDGWCYIDPDQGIGSEALIAQCPDTERRKVRFIGHGNPGSGRPTVLACAGRAYDL